MNEPMNEPANEAEQGIERAASSPAVNEATVASEDVAIEGVVLENIVVENVAASESSEAVVVDATSSLEQEAVVDQELKHLLEATLLAAGRPVTTQQLFDLFEERSRPTPEQMQAALSLLEQDYASRGIELVQVASGWRIQVRSRYVESVSRLWQERPSKYSRALLETLALVAYRQPITRSEIEEIRGVSISSTIMRTLQERNWIRVVGHREVPGRPELLGTTREFLDYFGLQRLEQLPTLAELKDLETIGVQLELPGGSGSKSAANSDAPDAVAPDVLDAPDEQEAPDETAGSVEEEPVVDTAADDPELSADAEAEADDEIDDDVDEAPTLVASADDERDESRYIADPPADDR